MGGAECENATAEQSEPVKAEPKEKQLVVEETESQEDPAGLWPVYVWSLCFSLIFGGCDFYMVGIVAEASGPDSGIDVANHIFFPVSLVQGLASPLLGELVDRCKDGQLLAKVLLCMSSLGTFLSVQQLVYATTPALGLLYALVRGLSGCVFFTLVGSGTLFMMMGVPRSQIGRVLGKGTLATIAGTGVGPFIYGLGKDVQGSFWVPVTLSSVPHLLFGLFFGAQICFSCCSRKGVFGPYSSVGSTGEQPQLSSEVIGSPSSRFEEHASP